MRLVTKDEAFDHIVEFVRHHGGDVFSIQKEDDSYIWIKPNGATHRVSFARWAAVRRGLVEA